MKVIPDKLRPHAQTVQQENFHDGSPLKKRSPRLNSSVGGANGFGPEPGSS